MVQLLLEAEEPLEGGGDVAFLKCLMKYREGRMRKTGEQGNKEEKGATG